MNIFMLSVIIGICLCAVNALVIIFLKSNKHKQRIIEQDTIDLTLVEEDLNKELAQLQSAIEQNAAQASEQRVQLDNAKEDLQVTIRQAQELLTQMRHERDGLEFLKRQLEVAALVIKSPSVESEDAPNDARGSIVPRETVELLLEKGLSLEEIAQRLDTSVSEIKLRVAMLNKKHKPIFDRQSA